MKGLDAQSNGRSGSLVPLPELEKPAHKRAESGDVLWSREIGNRFQFVGIRTDAAMLDDVAYPFHALLREEEFFWVEREAGVLRRLEHRADASYVSGE